MTRDIEKSRIYEYGPGKEFETHEQAMAMANHKRYEMIVELGTKKKLDGEPKIVDTGCTLQVEIPVMWEN